MRKLMYFLLGVLIAFTAMLPYARAETIPATSNEVVVSDLEQHKVYYCTGGATENAQACADRLTGSSGCTYTVTSETQSQFNLHFSCPWGSSGDEIFTAGFVGGCPAGSSWNGSDCVTVTYSCPSNQGWSLEGASCSRQDCPFERNPDGTCKGQCEGKGGTDAGTGIYEETPPQLICKTGCAATRSLDLGDPNRYSKIISGSVKYYGSYSYTFADAGGGVGVPCSAVSSSLESSTAPSIVDPNSITESCGAGQGMASMGGKTICVDQNTGQPVTSSGTTQRDTQTTTNTVTNSDGSTTTTKTTTYPDGSKTIEITNTAPGGGPSSTSKTEIDSTGKPVIVTGPAGSGTTGGGGAASGLDKNGVRDGVKEGVEKYCEAHPNSPICKEEEEGGPQDQGATIEGLYQKQSGDKTFTSVLTGFKNTVSGLPFFAAATGAFSLSIPAGACSGLSASIPIDFMGLHAVWDIDLTDTFCGDWAYTVFTIFGIGLLLTAAWVGIRIAFL